MLFSAHQAAANLTVSEGSRKHAGIKRKHNFALHVEWKKKISHRRIKKPTEATAHKAKEWMGT